MGSGQLSIAMELIEILAKQSGSYRSSEAEKSEQVAVKKIIDAARSHYVLPDFCAEMNDKASKCIACIIEQKTPAVCYKKITEEIDEEIKGFDVVWRSG